MTLGPREGKFEYDVALSFAGEQRQFVERTAAELRRLGVRVFYDDYEKVSLWGKDLYEHLDYVYQRAARFCVVFVSDAYAKKVWTTHERKSAQARAIREAGEYILPYRFDETELPGLRSTVGHLSQKDADSVQLAALIVEKLGPRERVNYLPPEPLALYAALGADTGEEQDAVLSIAVSFFHSLTRMTEPERVLLAKVFTEGCASELPKNVHMELDLVRRDLGVSPAEAVSALEGMVSLGVSSKVRTDKKHKNDVVVVKWHDRTSYPEGSLEEEFSFARSTEIAEAMFTAGLGHYCSGCVEERVRRLDFSDLASAPSVGA